MSRPRKATVDYFPHDVSLGKTMFVLESKWGNDGYAAWFKILERLGCSDMHFIDCRDRATLLHLAAYCRVSDGILTDMLDTLSDLDAIDRDLWRQKVVFCQHFVERITDAYRRRMNSLPTREKVIAVIKDVSDGRNPPEHGNMYGRNPQRERERERESKENPPPDKQTDPVETDSMTCGQLRQRYEEVTKRRINSGSEITVLQELVKDFTAEVLEEGLQITARASPDKPLSYLVKVMRNREPPAPNIPADSPFLKALEEERRQRAATTV